MATKIRDERGRIGIITEERSEGYFARPEGVPYIQRDRTGITGVAGAQMILATFWTRQPDGRLRGLWADSKLGDFVTAEVLA